MESAVKQRKTDAELRSDILNRVLPLGGTGVPILLEILSSLDLIDAYSVCGPQSGAIHRFL